MNKIVTLLFLVISFSFLSKIEAQPKKPENFSLIAFGDMPYFLPEDYARFENLIKTVNNQNQAFNVFVGDFKSSGTPCTEENYQKIYNYFTQFKKPLIYTPGDNEWTDCTKKEAGGYDAEERLKVIRKMFFNKDHTSFGMEKIKFYSQSKDSAFSKFVENNLWNFKGITFATIHLVGTNNNFIPESKNYNKEFYERSEANSAWIRQVFAKAKEDKSPGLVFFTQADMFNSDKGASGFNKILKELNDLTIDFGKPVLWVNGDSHEFLIDKPIFSDKKKTKALLNFTRVQVFGEADMHAVKIVINPANPSLFEVQELLIPSNQ